MEIEQYEVKYEAAEHNSENHQANKDQSCYNKDIYWKNTFSIDKLVLHSVLLMQT